METKEKDHLKNVFSDLQKRFLNLESKYKKLQELYASREESYQQLNAKNAERIKELTCFYHVSSLVMSDISIDKLLESVVKVIPPSMQHSDDTEAKIAWKNRVYVSKGFQDTPWSLKVDLVVNSENVGYIEVVYVSEKTEEDEGAFLKEERYLLESISCIIGKAIESRIYDDYLKKTITQLQATEQELRASNQQLQASEQQMESINQQLMASNQQLMAHEQQLKANNQVLKKSEKKLLKLNKDLEESKEKFRKLSETTPTSIMMYQNDKWIYANKAATDLCGYAMDELAEMNFWDFVHPDYQQEIKDRGRLRQKNVEDKNTYEFKIISKDGTEKWVSLRGSTIKVNDAYAGVITVIDETAIKQYTHKLTESEKKYRSLIDNASEGFWLINDKFEAIEVNDFLCSLLGYKKEEILGKNPIEFFDEANQKIAQYHMSKMDSTEHRIFEIEVRRKDGTHLPIMINATTLRDEAGNLKGSFSFVKDISMLKNVEKQLIDAREVAQNSDKLKSAFLANMSHEVRTPMNGILGFTELLKGDDLSTDDKDYYVDIIQKSGERMLNTINDIIDISKIESGQMELQFSSINLKELFDEIYESFLEEAESKSLKFSLDFQIAKRDLNIRSDANKLTSILNKLIKNAIKYTMEGSVNIQVYMKDSTMHCVVKDTGIGIPKGREDAIFNRFEQADIGDKHALQGSGLGLSISLAFIKMLDGEISCKSEEGVGTEFSFWVPVNQVTKSMADSNEYIEKSKKLKGLKLLIAEDDQVSFDYLNLILEAYCSEIVHATNGYEALNALKNQSDFDLVLMDMKMPTMNGFDAVKQIRKFNHRIPIIAQTAFGLMGDREKVLEAACDEYISKPINENELLKKMSDLL
jgi:PAS domain S-box-containing protein